MRFYQGQHTYYLGIDLHVENMYLCILDSKGEVLLHKNIKTKPELFLLEIAPYREGLVVGCECMYTWYWLADLCCKENIEFVLGHALYMKAVHGGKAKNDKLDSLKIATMLKGGVFPIAFVYPRDMRATRDFMRRRLFYVNRRAELMGHVKMTHHQYNLPAPSKHVRHKATRDSIKLPFQDQATVCMIESDFAMIEHYTKEINKIELFIRKSSIKSGVNNLTYQLLKTIPGVGDTLSLTILYETQSIERFPTVQKFCSYSRLVKPEKTSAGKRTGSGGGKIGNHFLKWAFSEATALMLRNSDEAKFYMNRLLKNHSKPKAMNILAHRIGKASYFIMKRQEAFNNKMFFA